MPPPLSSDARARKREGFIYTIVYKVGCQHLNHRSGRDIFSFWREDWQRRILRLRGAARWRVVWHKVRSLEGRGMVIVGANE